MRRALSLFALLWASSAFAADEVTMTLPEYLRLYETARQRPGPDEAAPRDFSLASTDYTGEVVTDATGEPVSVRLEARMRVVVHKDKGWVRVPLLPTSVAIGSATLGGAPAPIVAEGGYYTLVTDKKGTLDLVVQLAVGVQTTEGTSSFAFEMLPTGTATLNLAVPAADALDFTVANARWQDQTVERGRRVVQATLPGTGAVSVRWQREIPEAEREDPRVYAEVYTLVGVDEGLLRSTTTVQSNILFAGVDTFRYRVPKDMTLLDVRGSGVRDWSMAEGRELVVSLNYAAEGAFTLVIEAERVIGEASAEVAAPLIQPLGVERSKGWVGVESGGNLEIGAGDVRNATPVDVRTLPARILGITEQPVLLGYKYLGTDVDVPLVVTHHDEVEVLVTLLDQAEATTMFTADGRRLTSVRYEVRNNRRQYLRLTMPAGAEVWSAAVAGRSVQPARSGEGDVLIPLVRSQSAGGTLASFAVEVVYVESGERPDAAGRGHFEASLPRADVPVTWYGWTVWVPEQAKVKKGSVDGSLRHVVWLSQPLGGMDALVNEVNVPMQQQVAQGQVSSGALGEGAAPVRVRLPVEGVPYYFEKLLVLDEDLTVGFDFTGLK